MECRVDDKDEVLNRGQEMDHTSLLISAAARSSTISNRMPYDSEDIAEGPEETQPGMELIGGRRVLADPETQDNRH
jgi:hypothetical protein